MEGDDTVNKVQQTFIACRVTIRFKEKIDAYAHSRDMSVSQLMRKLLKREMEDNGVPPISGWSMHDKS
jgi:hypothetical protein